jgi:hypothetical protein
LGFKEKKRKNQRKEKKEMREERETRARAKSVTTITDVSFEQFVDAYPPSRRKGGAKAREVFHEALGKAPFLTLMVALAQHKRSIQWQNPRFIPSMITWLEQERWIQVLPEKDPENLHRLTPFQHAKRLGLK